MGMLNCLNNSLLKFLHITAASVPEFEIDGHYYTSPNQEEEPPTISVSHSEPLPNDAFLFQYRGRVWALDDHPYLPFILFSPFHGMMTSRLSTPPEEIPLNEDAFGYHLPDDVSQSWKTLEQSCGQIITVLRALFVEEHPKTPVFCSAPPNPSQSGYSKRYRTTGKARIALSNSLDAFVLLFAYVSFCIAICRKSNDPASISSISSTSTPPGWFQRLSLRIHPEWLQLLADSPISNFTTTPQRVGTIINVSRCSWFDLVPYMLRANVPVWFYWGTPPLFLQPRNVHALVYAPRSHPKYRGPPLSVITPSQSVGHPTLSQSVSLPTPSQSVGPPTQSQSVGPPTQSQSVSPPTQSQSVNLCRDQLPGETWKDFMTRQNKRREAKISKENYVERQKREGRESEATRRSYPGKKGPTVFIWENENGVWNRVHVTRGQVEREWGRFSSTQMIFNSIDNCWDLCFEFDEGTAGEMYEYDSNDSDNDTYRPPAKQSRRSPTPKKGRSVDSSARPPIFVDSMPHSVLTPAHVSSDCTPMVIDPIPFQISSDPLSMPVDPTPPQISPDPPSMLVDPTPPQTSSDPPPLLDDLTTVQIPSDTPMLADLSDSVPQFVPAPAQVASAAPVPFTLVDAREPAPLSLSMPLQQPNLQSEGDFIDSDEDDEDPYDTSMKDVLNAYSFVALDLEQMPVTTLDDLLYYRYGFSLKESPYTGVPLSVTKVNMRTFRSWTEVCRSVGGQQLESSAVMADRKAIEDFLSILAGSTDPFKDVPGKYWDLSPFGLNPIVDLDKVFISIEERRFSDGRHYIIRPRFLHPSRDTSWLLSVDPMTALECIRRGLGPHTIDISNFLISHGVRFHTLQHIPNSEKPPVRPFSRYLGYRSAGHSFDLADYAGYEVMRDSFLRSQSHGPLALREGGIIARLAREVLPNSNALSGPSSEALLSGHCARFTYGDEIYVDDSFLEEELGLICGTYVLSNSRGGNELSFKLLLVLIWIFQLCRRRFRGFRHKTSGTSVGTTLASGPKSAKDGSGTMSQKYTLVPSSHFLRKTGVLSFAALGLL